MKVIRFLQVWCNAILNTIKIFFAFAYEEKENEKFAAFIAALFTEK